MSEQNESRNETRSARPPIHVTGGDYEYDGWLVAFFLKRSGERRYVVEDSNGRLFIHNAKQLGKSEGWIP